MVYFSAGSKRHSTMLTREELTDPLFPAPNATPGIQCVHPKDPDLKAVA